MDTFLIHRPTYLLNPCPRNNKLSNVKGEKKKRRIKQTNKKKKTGMGSSYLYGTDQMCFTKQVFIILFTDFSYGHNKVLKQTHLFSADNVQFDFTHLITLQY